MAEWQKECVGRLPRLGVNSSFFMCSQLALFFYLPRMTGMLSLHLAGFSLLVFCLASPSPSPSQLNYSTFWFQHLFPSPAVETSKEFHLLCASNRPIKIWSGWRERRGIRTANKKLPSIQQSKEGPPVRFQWSHWADLLQSSRIVVREEMSEPTEVEKLKMKVENDLENYTPQEERL